MITPVETRWNAEFDSVEDILHYKEHVSKLCIMRLEYLKCLKKNIVY